MSHEEDLMVVMEEQVVMSCYGHSQVNICSGSSGIGEYFMLRMVAEAKGIIKVDVLGGTVLLMCLWELLLQGLVKVEQERL